MKSLLLDIYKNEVKVVDASTLEDYYKLLSCDTIDIVRRRIGKKQFEIVCDDEGLFRDACKISAINNLGEIMLVGSLLICGLANEEGELTDLTDSDIEYVKDRIMRMGTRLHPEGYYMLTQCEY